MPNWVKVGTDLAVGGAAGVTSKLAEDWDGDRQAKQPAVPLSFFSRASNYVDYGVPLLAVIGCVTGFLRGEWETRALSIGGVLAGRRVTAQVKGKASGWVPMHSPAQLPAPKGAPAPSYSRAWVPRAIS